MSTALQMYLQDYDHRFPPASYVSGTQSYTLPYLLYPYIKNAYVFGCPEGHPEGTKAQYDQSQADTSVDYGYNAAALTQDGRGIAEDRVLEPAATVVLAESSSYRTAPTALTPALGGTPPVYRHQETNNVAFADGHVKALRREVLEMNSESESGHRLGSGIDRFPYWNLR
jgi:prepilin-type processing-associated H-X9-DG protein